MNLNRRKRVLVAGSANMDLVMRVSRCPKPGESLVGHSFNTVPGGKGANQAVAAARLGAVATFIGAVGDDTFGVMLRENLQREGVDVTYVRTHDAVPTGTASIYVTDSGDNAIVVTPAANNSMMPADVEALRSVIAAQDVVMTQLEIRFESVETLLRIAREEGVFSILDAGPVRDAPMELLKLADLVSPNETEAEAFTGVAIESNDDTERAVVAFHDAGRAQCRPETRRARRVIRRRRSAVQAPAFEVNAIDTVAAGDAFTAALAIAWDASNVEQALRYANAAGALATTKPGAQDAMPTRDEVNRFLMDKDHETTGLAVHRVGNVRGFAELGTRPRRTRTRALRRIALRHHGRRVCAEPDDGLRHHQTRETGLQPPRERASHD
jgi:ribokinase